ncbi:hypothetical protein TCAL_10719 [Tigriopus californicus]|uniref:Uncharacterized protein n=1 Tax=Tigriopus californicus TaxID=6832 RepID=A0A553N982_TIGCA|nr:uncharacterized protein LOC131885553 [Tigriopus californicus]TRY61982.1 hypothetical protein TCAL_10719 [Tigriopus californicus]|eukprot:TCALIF_10719-PA protein Name:"Protein of unknown function" AED:0.00 eAED:0.00 QI:97/1/1/1/1/1/3/345/549
MSQLFSVSPRVFLPRPSFFKLEHSLAKRLVSSPIGMSGQYDLSYNNDNNNNNNNNNNNHFHPSLSDYHIGEEDSGLLSSSSRWDCDGCAPPTFNLPPPPRPPWLEDFENCNESPSQSELIAQLETCDNTIILNSPFEDTFHSVLVILVCAFVAVIVLLLLAIAVFKKRKESQQLLGTSHFSHPCQSHDPRGIIDSSGPPSSTFSRLGDSSGTTSLGPHKVLFQPSEQLLPSSSTHSITSQIKRISSTSASMNHQPHPHPPPPYHNHPFHHPVTASHSERVPGQHASNQCQTLPNHYIPGPSSDGKSPAIERLGRAQPSNTMQLSDQPPAPPHLYHSYPHIIIGGQPFYLIPSDPNSACSADCDTDSYAYPQNVPIYEEIDPYATSCGSTIYPPPSDLVEAGSSIGTPTLGHGKPMQRLPNRFSGRVMVNPLLRGVQDHSEMTTSLNHAWDHRNASPVSTCSTAKKSPVASTSGGSTSSSMYYYSDTMKPGPECRAPQSTPAQSKLSRLSSDSSDSGLGNHRPIKPPTSDEPVNTQIILDSESRNNASSV